MAEQDQDQKLYDYLSQLDGRGAERGPASEATLRALAKHMGVKGLGAGPSKSPAEANREKAVKEEAKQVEEVTDQLSEWEFELRRNQRGMYSLWTGTKMFSNQLMSGSMSVEGFAQTLTTMADVTGNVYLYMLMKSVEQLAKLIDTQVDNFKQLSEVGIQFSDGLFTTRELALRASLSLDAFSNALGKSADTLALLGGSVRGGTERFTDISRLLQGEFRSTANGLGMTFEETTDLLTDYLEIQTSIGRAQNMTNRELNAGAQDFIMNLDQLSAITGKQRKQIADAVKADMMEQRIKGIIQSLESSMVPGVQEILGSLQGLPADTQNAFKELIATGGVPLSDFAKSLVRLNPQIGTFAREVSFGRGTVEGFEAIIRQTAERSQSLGSTIQRQGGLMAELNSQVLGANVELFNFTKFGAERNKVEEFQAKAIQATSNQILGFKDAFKDIQNFAITVLLPVLQVLGTALGFVANGLNGLLAPLINSENAAAKFAGTVLAGAGAMGALMLATKLLGKSFGLLGGLMGKLIPSFGGGAAMGGMKALGSAGPAVAKGGLFAGAGIGALLGLSGAGAGLGIAAIGKGLQTFNNVDGKNLSDVASATKDLIAALVSGVANPGDLATAVSGMKTYAKSMSEALDDLDKDKLSLYTTKLEELAGAFREVNTSMSGAITTSGRTNQDKLDGISTLLAEIKLVMEDVANSNKSISRKTSNSNVYNT